ncbi:uncharacterized protein LOC135462060 [Liolophura sinensis]|uniref:uncharacterized protein LOC135462060 n=1 Tax=Liolophura sinensis TaxID=3198878 RepID=UPI0031596C41
MEAITAVGLLLVISLVVKYALDRRSRKNLPPGPPRKFLIDNLLDVNPDRLHISFTDISKKYGDVFSIRTGGKTVVVVNTIDAFRELFEEGKYGDKLDGREKTFVAQVLAEDKGVPLASNTPGRKQRRTAMFTACKNFSHLHGSKLEEEIKHLIELVRKNGPVSLDMDKVVQQYVTNINLTMLTGERYSYEDARLLAVMERANIVQSFIRAKTNSVMTMFPWLRFLPFIFGPLYQRYLYLTKLLKEAIFDPAKDSYHPDIVRGGLDELLKVQKEALGNVALELTDEHLSMTALAVAGAGTAVPIGNLLYFIVVILNKPEIAEKLRQEMDSVIGRSHSPKLADRSRLTYAEAVVLELLRWGSPAPILVPRRAEEDIQFREYTIPKDATVITNAWKILHDEALWKNPWEFQPERFLDPNGGLLTDLQRNVIAFGGGRRKCIGVDMAFDLTFLFVTSMVKHFDFEAPSGKVPKMDPHFHTADRVGIKPEPFTVIAKSRRSVTKMDAFIAIALLLLVLLVVKFFLAGKSPRNLPPGPPAKFLIGNLLDVKSSKVHESFTDISREYGDVFSVQTVGPVVVVVNTIEAFRELYEENRYGEKIDGRQKSFATQFIGGSNKDVALAQNSAGRKKRRAALYTATKILIENYPHKLQEEVGHLLKLIGSLEGEGPQDLLRPIHLYLVNIMLIMLTGQRYEYDDPRMSIIIESATLQSSLVLPKTDSILTLFPFLRFLPFGYGKTINRCKSLSKKLKEIIYDTIKVSYNPAYLRGGIDEMIKAQKESLGNIALQLTDDHLHFSAMSTISAGSGVIQGTCLYFIVVILNQPEVSENLRKEMDSVLGKFRSPTLADRSKMIYAEAVVLELLRWACPTPLLLPRAAEEEVQFRGYTIPKDATVITNAWKIQHDDSLWRDPWTFRPQRFIGPTGYILNDLRKNIIVFGGGRRNCFGEGLAYDMLFLFVTSLVRKFDFEVAKGEAPTLDPRSSSPNSAGIKPEPFKVIVKSRSK